jgi:hypothetical protein
MTLCAECHHPKGSTRLHDLRVVEFEGAEDIGFCYCACHTQETSMDPQAARLLLCAPIVIAALDAALTCLNTVRLVVRHLPVANIVARAMADDLLASLDTVTFTIADILRYVREGGNLPRIH